MQGTIEQLPNIDDDFLLQWQEILLVYGIASAARGCKKSSADWFEILEDLEEELVGE
jgi:hypothetical protein